MEYKTIIDSKKQFVKVPVEPPAPLPTRTDVAIDDLLNKGLLAIERAMKRIVERSCTLEGLEREDIQNLKDLMSILQTLREQEQEALKNLSDSELEAIADENLHK